MNTPNAMKHDAGPKRHRKLSLVVVLGAIGLIAAACQFDPAAFAGYPTLSHCNGVPATIGVGWIAEDGVGATYSGTEGRDVVVITSGPVTFNGLGGNDLICVNDTGMNWGQGNVVVTGGPGNDTVHNFSTTGLVAAVLGEGNDTYNGGPGPDVVIGQAGNDTITTGDGDDSVLGGDGNDTITTGDGDDSLDAGPGNDTITTGDGDDSLFGNDGEDIISSGAGNDEVHTGIDADVVDAGPGDDMVFGNDHVDEVVDCGEGDEVTGDTLTDWGQGSAVTNCEILVPS